VLREVEEELSVLLKRLESEIVLMEWIDVSVSGWERAEQRLGTESFMRP
jgi:hypothetical protein